MRLFYALTILFSLLGVPSARAAEDYGVIYSGQKDDQVYNSLVVSATERFEAESGIRFRQRIITNEQDSAEAIRAFVDRGITTLLLVGYVHEKALAQLAPIYPHARFTIIDSAVKAPNVRSIRFREQEAGFLAGMAAGFASKAAKLAFIGAVATPPVQRFGCGFVQGARETGRSLSVITRYMTEDMEGFRDRRLARVVAEELVNEGVDVLFPAAGIASRDALLTVAQAGRLGIGVDSDQEALAPGHIVTTALKRVDVAVATALRDLVKGDWAAGTQEFGIAEGGVDWVRQGADRFLTPVQIKAIESAKQRIRTGRLSVRQTDPACEQPELRLAAQGAPPTHNLQ
jgi:basic membrane protein A